MTYPIEAEPIGLKPEDKVVIHGDLLSAQGAILLELEAIPPGEGFERKRLERRARIYEKLYREFAPLGLELSHTDKTRFFDRIQAFFLEIEKASHIREENFYHSAQIYQLLFQLLTFAIIHSPNISARMGHVHSSMQDLYRKIGTSIRILQELQRNSAA